jgi:hypothetical protein
MRHDAELVVTLLRPDRRPMQYAKSLAVLHPDLRTKICDTLRARKHDAQLPLASMLYCPGKPTCCMNPTQ